MSTHTHHGHDHAHDGHEHEGMLDDVELSERARRVLAMEELLAEKGVIGASEMQRLIDFQEARSPVDGARVVARAWTDADYKRRLLADPEAALLELGYPLVGSAKLAVLENTDAVHHLVVCTLCSCYPTSLLGLPPDWYKSFAYRSRAVVDPRGVMREFGLDVGDGVEVRVVDSTAELRYLVLPQRPTGTEGMSEDELIALVTRDSMVGVGVALAPVA
ncbi:MAG: nitrile hydratase subunit alpha [Chloroflexota bacterium]|nr:nitrile hydratase subunit alpha [Chloroflexota bacterium]